MALNIYIEHEKESMIAMEETLGSFSIRSNMSTVSAISMSERVRMLPHSRLREASSPAEIYQGSLARSNSVLTSRTAPEDQGVQKAKEESVRKRFKELAAVNVEELVERFAKINDRSLMHSLLELEQSLVMAMVCLFDV